MNSRSAIGICARTGLHLATQAFARDTSLTMKSGVTLSALALAMLLALSLPGCAAHDAYAKCGAGGCEGDAQITQQVEALFKQHPEFGHQVYVKTTDHVVFLTGQVATDLQRDTAASIARGVPGVTKVINNIALNFGR
jgi:osmotically-inducible protein OsmY